jgi:hypothetical protein
MPIPHLLLLPTGTNPLHAGPVVLGIELGVLCFLGKCSITSSITQSFCFFIHGLTLLPGLTSNCNPSISTS